MSEKLERELLTYPEDKILSLCKEMHELSIEIRELALKINSTLHEKEEFNSNCNFMDSIIFNMQGNQRILRAFMNVIQKDKQVLKIFNG